MCRSTNRQAEPEAYFRVVHLAQNGPNSAPVAAYREQIVEIALGPKGAFENGNIGALTRRAPPDQMLSFVLPGRGEPKPPREPKTPRVVELLRKAIKWKNLLESGKIASQAEIARQEGITRARAIQSNLQGRACWLRRFPSTVRAKILPQNQYLQFSRSLAFA